MKMNFIVGAAMAVLLAGCGPSGCGTIPGTGGVSAAAQATTVDEKAVISAEAAFQTTSILINVAIDSGQLKGAKAKQVGVYYDAAHKALVAARGAYKLGNATAMTSQIELAQTLVGQMADFLPKKGQ